MRESGRKYVTEYEVHRTPLQFQSMKRRILATDAAFVIEDLLYLPSGSRV